MGEDEVWLSARVGLVLREEASEHSSGPKTHSLGRPAAFCTRPYRFSTTPERITKFRSGFAAVAHLDGQTNLSTRLRLTGGSVEKYLAAVSAGKESNDPTKWTNRKVETQPDFCE